MAKRKPFPRSGKSFIEKDFLAGHRKEIRTLFAHGIRASRLHLEFLRYQQMVNTIRMTADDIQQVIDHAKRGLDMEDSIYDLMLPERDNNHLLSLGFETIGDVFYAEAEHVDGYRGYGRNKPSIRIAKAFDERGMKWPTSENLSAPSVETPDDASATRETKSTSRRQPESGKSAKSSKRRGRNT